MVQIALALVLQVSEAPETSIAALTKNVGVLPTGGIPGPVAVLGGNAFPVIQSGDGKENLAMAAATTFGRGRVLASTKINIGGDDPDSRQFTVNALKWLCPARTPKKIATLGLSGTAKGLRGLGFDVVEERGEANWSSYDVVLIDGHSLQTSGQVDGLRTYVERGGGLSVTGLAWGWAQITGKSIRNDALYNKLLVPMGLALSDGYLGSPLSPQDAKNLSWEKLNAARILLRLETAGNATAAEAKQMSGVLTNALGVVPADNPLLVRLKALAHKGGSAAVPTAQKPLRLDNVLGRADVLLRDAEYRTMTAANLPADPAAADFPGLVPSEAKRENVPLSLDLSGGQWVSTGLYLNAGETAVIRHPELRNLRFQVGCHTDTNWHHDNWTRFPSLVYAWPATGGETKIASPFGGLIYVLAPRNSGGAVSMNFSGVVRSPRYVRGKTSPEEWRQMVEQAAGPWAEFESERLILTVPSAAARKVSDPQELMALWERIMDLYVKLGTRPITHKERIVTDRQISAGYMHSGYPIMTGLDVQDLVVSTEKLTTEGSWGHWHELGHNHQQSAWTFDGTTEVTCNLFTMYVYEHVINRAAGEDRVKAGEPKFRAFIEKGAPYSEWKADPFLALYMYWQLRDAFGWEAYEKVFAGYRDADRAALPKNDQEKRDQWMTRFSRTVGKNLGPFFEAWGVPTSAEARQSLKDLPTWMPERFPTRKPS